MTVRSLFKKIFRNKDRYPVEKSINRERFIKKRSSINPTALDLKLFKQAIDGLAEGVIITDARQDNPVVYINDQFLQEIGYSREEIIGKNPRILQGPESDASTIRQVRECIRKKERFRGEIINYRKDGSYFHNLMTITPVFNESGELTHFIGLQSNISYRIEIEKELKKSNDLFNYAAKATKDVIWNWDFMLNRKEWQASVKEVFGHEINDQCTDPGWFFEHIHEADRDRIQTHLQNILKEKKEYWQDEYKFLTREGTYKHILDRAFILYDELKRPLRMIGAMQDLTAHHKLLDTQIHLIKELSHSNKDLQQFGYIVSHNLRGSIASIRGLTNVLELQYHHVPQDTQLMITHLSKMAENLDTTIKDLVEILRIRTEFNELKEKIYFEDIYEQVRISLQDQIENSQAKISLDFENAPYLHTLKSYLFSILYNLLSNSIKYRAPNRPLEISISTFHNNGYLILKVEDNGMGIDLISQKDKVFGLYKRFHLHIEGKGMGLYLIKTQVESLGGKVEVESKINEGATFKICFRKN